MTTTSYSLNGTPLTLSQVSLMVAAVRDQQRRLVDRALVRKQRIAAARPRDEWSDILLVPTVGDLEAEIDEIAAEWLDLEVVAAAGALRRDGTLDAAVPADRAAFDVAVTDAGLPRTVPS